MDLLQAAIKIIRQLQMAGHTSYIAGGWVRDYLLGLPSVDIDIATSASTDQIEHLFEKTIPLGLSFGIVVVLIEGHRFEVASFRKDGLYLDGRHPRSVEFASPIEDAKRRDFTINGMFYDPLEKKIWDFVNGQEDLQRKIIRTIGDPVARFTEDRLRMIRAIRFACTFNFQIDDKTQTAIKELAPQLFPAVAIERIWQELCKMAKSGSTMKESLNKLFDMHLLQQIFPPLKAITKDEMMALTAHFDQVTGSPLLYIMELFPYADTQMLIELVFYLKLSKQQQQIAKTLGQLRLLLNGSPSLYAWISFYAQPEALDILKITSLRLKDPHLITHHQRVIHQYSDAINRIKNKTPLVTAAMLQKEGISPSPLMGHLLNLAEEIAVEKHVRHPEDVLRALKTSAHWPKN